MTDNRKHDTSSLTPQANDAILKEIQTLFMRTESVVRGTRITRRGDIVQPVDDLAGGIEGIMRVFKHDMDAVKAETMLSQIQSQLTHRFKTWEAETQQLQRAKVEVHNSPSGDQLRKMAAEIAMVKTSVSTALAKIRALATALSQFQNQSAKPSRAAIQATQPIDVANLSSFEKLVVNLIDKSFEFCADDGQKIGFGSRVREMIVDRKKKLFLVVQWNQWGSGKLMLNFWLVPKSPLVAEAMPESSFDKLILTTGSNGVRTPVTLEIKSAENSRLPARPEIKQFIEAVDRKRFSHASFLFLFASLKLELSFTDAVLNENYQLSFEPS